MPLHDPTMHNDWTQIVKNYWPGLDLSYDLLVVSPTLTFLTISQCNGQMYDLVTCFPMCCLFYRKTRETFLVLIFVRQCPYSSSPSPSLYLPILCKYLSRPVTDIVMVQILKTSQNKTRNINWFIYQKRLQFMILFLDNYSTTEKYNYQIMQCVKV